MAHAGLGRLSPERDRDPLAGHVRRRAQMSELVSDNLLERLDEWRVKRIYGYPGDEINGFLGALDRAQERIDLQVRHKEMAAFMAPKDVQHPTIMERHLARIRRCHEVTGVALFAQYGSKLAARGEE